MREEEGMSMPSATGKEENAFTGVDVNIVHLCFRCTREDRRWEKWMGWEWRFLRYIVRRGGCVCVLLRVRRLMGDLCGGMVSRCL